MPVGVWASGGKVSGEARLVFASPEVVLGGGLEPSGHTLFPTTPGDVHRDSYDIYESADTILAWDFHSIGLYSSLHLIDPWEEDSGTLGNANLEAPGALELAWEAPEPERYCWGCAVGQTLLFFTIGHAFRLASEEKTRTELEGPFFRDWFKSAGALYSSGWSDGGKFFTNYVVHPLSGSVYGHIYRQNHPNDRDVRISLNKRYLGHMGKTTAFSFVTSLAWEIGPYSEASIGNVGLHNTPESQQMTWGDIVITPVLGVWGAMVIEDLFERYVIRKVEARTSNRWIKALFRIPLTPTRSVANLMAFRRPDYRPDRQ